MSLLLEGDPGREPLLFVEIDQDLCALTYGVSPCTAALGVTGEDKCYNTRKSCQDPANYSNTATNTLRFGRPQSALPLDLFALIGSFDLGSFGLASLPPTLPSGFPRIRRAIPFLVSVSTTPTRVNVGGRRGRDGSLGKRATVTVTMQDYPYSDLYVDPYVTERSFDPFERGTFWSKWLARNPYYVGRALRVIEGYAGQDMTDMQTRHYIIDKIEGPDSSGKVTVRASDILRLADDDQARAPELSKGELSRDANTSGTVHATAAPGEYTASGIIRVDNEVIRYTNIVEAGGVTSFIPITRGTDGTTAAEHEAGATVQQCIEFVNTKGWEVARDLLIDYANIPTAFIDSVAWQAEADKWAGGFVVSRVLTEPIGVNTLVGELCEQGLFYIWWDDRAKEIKLRTVRPPLPAEVVELGEDKHLLQGETRLRARPEERISEVWISHGLRSAVDDVRDRASYLNTRARIDPTAASLDEHGIRKVYEVLSPWLVGNAQANPLSFRILARYRDVPNYLTTSIDAKDRAIVSPGEVVDITYRGFVDLQGAPESRRYEVTQMDEVVSGERIRLELQPSQFLNRYAYIMDNGSTGYSTYTEATRPAFSGFLCPPKTAGPAEKFPDNSDPYVFA